MKILKCVALVIGLGACAFSGDITPDDGVTFMVENKTYDQIWSAGILTVAARGSIQHVDKEAGEIRGFESASAHSNGNALGVFIYPPDPNATTFRVSTVGVKFSKVQITGTDFSETMRFQMQAHLGGIGGE